MGKQAFHHPDLSWALFRRRFGDEILHLVSDYAEILYTRGKSLTWAKCYDDDRRYYDAVRRLRREGLVVSPQGPYHAPRLTLTEEGERRMHPAHRPEKAWSAKWGGTWYLLTYDVPEADRRYRNTLRRFLVRMRMGCLQRSVWVSHRDIRGEYADLADAAGIRPYAFLLEAQTLLGLEPWQLASQAWSLDQLEREQRAYCAYVQTLLGRLGSVRNPVPDMEKLVREELTAYRAAMARDPLLPAELYPPGYQGREVLRLHRQIVEAIIHRLGEVPVV